MGFLTQQQRRLLQDVFQQMVEVRECHHIGERIRGERLSSRSCVVPRNPSAPKIPAARYQPLYEQRGDLVKKDEREGREESSLTQPASSLLLCFSGTHICQSARSFFSPFSYVWLLCIRLCPLLRSGSGSESFWCSTPVQSGFFSFLLSVQQLCVCRTS